MNERRVAIGSIIVLFLSSVVILTYQQGTIADLTSQIQKLKLRSKAVSGGSISFSEKAAPSISGTYELDVIKAVQAIPDYAPMLPPELSRGTRWTIRTRERIHFLGGNLVVLELQNMKGNLLPVLFQIPDPGQSVTWRYLYGFAPS
ncbi:MAG: hypothetical protein ACYCTV_11225 [Leptospirales bacterium]